ncbi:nucleoside phosphorylase domain-containing protein [Trichoderma evansii]
MEEKQLPHKEYTIGWICALPLEQTAAMYMLDERHKDLQNPEKDENTYTLGKVGGHNVVIVGLPKGRIGTNDSAAAVTRMSSTFPNIKFGIMVGVGGGIPEKTRLGDVVICSAVDTNSGVVQHDMGKAHADGQFETKGSLCGPPTAVLTALAKFQADPRTPRTMRKHLDDMAEFPDVDESFLKSDSLEDILFESDYRHVNKGKDCSGCDKSRIVQREPRRAKIHYGLIASGNTMVKDAKVRDELCKRYNDNLFCIEMEAAGLMNNFPCVVIRGICDYADSHAGKKWQNYAAAVAAACTKTLLGVVPEREVRNLQSVQDSIAFSSIRTSRGYDTQNHAANSPPPTPTKSEGTTASPTPMLEWPDTSYHNNSSGMAYLKIGEQKYPINHLIQMFGESFLNKHAAQDTEEALANLPHGSSQGAHDTTEEIDHIPTPPQSPKQDVHGHTRHPESGTSLRRTNTDPDSTQPLPSSEASDSPSKPMLRSGTTFPLDKHSSTGSPVFFDAIKTGDIATIKRQLQNGIDLEITDEFGCTPLWRAVDIGHRNVIQLLLNNGANYEAKNFGGQNVLGWALDKDKHDIVDMVCKIMDTKSQR